MSDSDWAKTKSTSGWIVMWQRAAIAWGSKQQPTIALSSCEAEIVASTKAAADTLFFRRFLTELGYPPDGPTPQATDNKAARDVAYNPEHHDRMKHVERKHFEITVPFVATDDNLADFFTKPLPPAKFFTLRDKIMNI